jgi:hypothetical protein
MKHSNPKRRATSSKSRQSQKRINWLQELDRDAPTLPPCTNWQTYDLFLYARYPLYNRNGPAKINEMLSLTFAAKRLSDYCQSGNLVALRSCVWV